MKKLVFSFILLTCVAATGFAQKNVTKVTKDETTKGSRALSLVKEKASTKTTEDKKASNLIIKGEDVFGKTTEEEKKKNQKKGS